MADCCVCYTSDQSYLFPTFVSACQARRYASRAAADVVVFSFDADAAANRVFARACAAEGIAFEALSSRSIDAAPSMLARLFLAELLPRHYARFLYVDGDTQILGDLEALLRHVPREGTFFAAQDPMTFAMTASDAHGRRILAHFRALGIDEAAAGRYFNSGVIYAARDGWSAIGGAAWDLFRRGGAGFRFPDQDAINIAGRAGHLPLSLAWNFPMFMRNTGTEREIAPRIHHFMSKPKPWEGNFPPWDAASCRPYRDALARHPDLHDHVGGMSRGRTLRYHLQQRYKKGLETFTWRFSAKRDRILRYERDVALLRPDPPERRPRRLAPPAIAGLRVDT